MTRKTKNPTKNPIRERKNDPIPMADKSKSPVTGQHVLSLIDNLKAIRWADRKNAAEELEKIGKPCVHFLEQSLYQENEDVRYWVTIILARIGGDGLVPLMKLLKDGDKRMRAFATRALGETNDRKVVPALINALGDSSWSVRKNAADSLIQLGKIALKPVGQALKKDNEDIRYWATRILGGMGKSGVGPLLVLLKKGNKDMRFFAAEALGDVEDPKSIKALIDTLSDPSWSVRKNAAKSLQKLGKQAVIPLSKALESPNQDIRFWVARILGKIGEEAITALLKQLKDEDSETRRLTRQVLDDMGGVAVEPLIKALQSKNREMRRNAAEALGNTRDPRSIQPLIRALADESWFVRKNAAEALEEMGNRAVPELTAALALQNEDIQYWSTRVLGNIGITDVSPLAAVLRDGNEEARYYAIEAMGRALNWKDSMAYLVEALKDPSWPVRRKAAESLEIIGPPVVEYLIQSIKDQDSDIRYWTLRILRSFGDMAMEKMCEMLNDPSPEQRLYAVSALQEFGNKKAVGPLSRSLTDKNEWVRRQCVMALGTLGDPVAVYALIEAMRPEPPDACQLIAKSIAKLGNDAIPGIKKSLDDPDEKMRENLMSTLSQIGSPEAMQILLSRFLSTEDESEADDIAYYIAPFGAIAVDPLLKFIPKAKTNQKKIISSIIQQIGKPALKHLKDFIKTEDISDTNIRWIDSLVKDIQPKGNDTK